MNDEISNYELEEEAKLLFPFDPFWFKNKLNAPLIDIFNEAKDNFSDEFNSVTLFLENIVFDPHEGGFILEHKVLKHGTSVNFPVHIQKALNMKQIKVNIEELQEIQFINSSLDENTPFSEDGNTNFNLLYNCLNYKYYLFNCSKCRSNDNGIVIYEDVPERVNSKNIIHSNETYTELCTMPEGDSTYIYILYIIFQVFVLVVYRKR